MKRRIINLHTSEEMGTYEADSDEEALAAMAKAKGWSAPDGGPAVFAEEANGEYLVIED